MATLSTTIEAHYQWMEQHLGKDKLAQLYALLDQVIALDAPEPSGPPPDPERRGPRENHRRIFPGRSRRAEPAGHRVEGDRAALPRLRAAHRSAAVRRQAPLT